jgi:hypothetical protein
MDAISINTTPDKFVISIDKKFLREEVVLDLVERLHIEHLAESINFDAGIEQMGTEIKADWWAKNKERILGIDK